MVTSYFCVAKASGKVRKANYFRLASCEQADIGLGRKCEPNQNSGTNFEMGSITVHTDRQQSKKDTPVSVLFVLLVTRTGIEPMLQP